MHTIASNKLLMLKPKEILPSKFYARKNIDHYAIRRLADSISVCGIIEPLAVRRTIDGEYELISGGRRLAAAKIAGLRRVPCVLHKADDVTAAFYPIIENIQHSSLHFFEEAESLSSLINKFDLTRTETAIRLGIAQSSLLAKLRLLQLSEEIKQRMGVSNLSEKHAMVLLKLPVEKREEVLCRIIAEDLNVKQSEALAEGILNPKEESEPVRKMAIGDVRIFANSLYKLVETIENAGMRVKINKSENEKYVEYKIKINKEKEQNGYQQLKIC